MSESLAKGSEEVARLAYVAGHELGRMDLGGLGQCHLARV